MVRPRGSKENLQFALDFANLVTEEDSSQQIHRGGPYSVFGVLTITFPWVTRSEAGTPRDGVSQPEVNKLLEANGYRKIRNFDMNSDNFGKYMFVKRRWKNPRDDLERRLLVQGLARLKMNFKDCGGSPGEMWFLASLQAAYENGRQEKESALARKGGSNAKSAEAKRLLQEKAETTPAPAKRQNKEEEESERPEPIQEPSKRQKLEETAAAASSSIEKEDEVTSFAAPEATRGGPIKLETAVPDPCAQPPAPETAPPSLHKPLALPASATNPPRTANSTLPAAPLSTAGTSPPTLPPPAGAASSLSVPLPAPLFLLTPSTLTAFPSSAAQPLSSVANLPFPQLSGAQQPVPLANNLFVLGASPLTPALQSSGGADSQILLHSLLKGALLPPALPLALPSVSLQQSLSASQPMQ